VNVTQVLCAAGPVDAVTNQGLAWRAAFAGWGWEGNDYAAHVAPGIPARRLHPLRSWRPRADQVVVLHYSGYVGGLTELMRQAPRSLLVSHNVTPAHYFWDHEPVDAARCLLAQHQLAELAATAGALAGVSRFNARELEALGGREAEVIPVLFDPHALGSPRGPHAATGGPGSPGAPPTILFVGRLAPHKRQDLVIRAFARLRRRLPEARLVLIGVPCTPEFEQALRRLADELAPGSVVFETGGISAERLAGHYRSAHAFACLSEHEGFCIPLLEAFHFGVPVVARDAGAVGEVVADAGVLLGPGDGTAVVAEVLRIVIEDGQLREELRRRAARRLAEYDPAATRARMRARLESLAA
jgi:glycosyltransferase involved in cell wall biosynthesis